MMQGKVKSALQVLSTNDNLGPLPLTDETLQELCKKHPDESNV